MRAHALRIAAGNAVAGDPYYSAVSLLLHFNGANGSTTFTDSSSNNLTVTPTNATISTTQSKFGGASGSFLTSGNYCSIADSPLFDFGSGDFSFEMWLYPTSLGAYRPIISKDTSTGRSWLIETNNSDIFFTIPNGTQVWIYGALTLNTWSHIYFGRSGSIMYSALNGQVSSVSYTATIPTTSTSVEIGRQGSYGGYFGGYIDELRITKGLARYTANFTVPSAPFPDRTGSIEADAYFPQTSLLLHMDGTNASTSFVDSGPNALAVTASGNAQISTAQSKFGGASGYFDGNGDTSTAPASSLFAFGTGDFTIEAWLYSLDTGSSERGIYDTRTTIYGAGIMLRENPSGFMVWANGGIVVSTSTGRIPNTWQHVAVVRKGTTLTLYVDGVSAASATFSANLTENGCRVSGFVDTQASPYAYNGYIDDLRITKGVARYTSNFTPRAKASPDIYNPYKTLPVSGAALWLAGDDSSSLFTDAGVTPVKVNGDLVYQWNDKSGNSRHATQTTSGNRPTWVPPASGRNGLGALAFNGSQTVLTSYNQSNFGTNDFTIEAWINTADASNIKAIAGTLLTGFDGGWQIRTGSGKFYFGIAVSGGVELADTATISANTWYHVAVTRSGTTLRTFVNGVNGGTLTNSSNISNTNSVRVGHDGGSTLTARIWNGKIQNLLIYKGQALYTSNFTPWMS